MTEEIINKDELKNLRFLLQSGQKLAISTKEFEKVFDEIDRLEQENEELKHRNENLRIALSTYEMPEVVKVLTDYRTGELQLQENKLNTYCSALEEIREIANENNFCASYACPPMFKILDKINEVLQ